MLGKRLIIFSMFVCCATPSQAQTITESWLSQAGISCGGGLSVELQGDIDAAVLRRLRAAAVEGEGTIKVTQMEQLLNQFRQQEQRQVYVDYVNCLSTLVSIATATSQLPPQEVVLDSPVAVASLETVRRGQRFVMVPGDTVAVRDHSLVLTVDRVGISRDRRYVYFTWSNSETGEGGNNRYVYQSALITIEEQCSIVPYQIDVDSNQVSFLSNC